MPNLLKKTHETTRIQKLKISNIEVLVLPFPGVTFIRTSEDHFFILFGIVFRFFYIIQVSRYLTNFGFS